MREKTDSITHLVKIVAKEVFNEEIVNYSHHMRVSLSDGAARKIEEIGATYLNNIKCSLEKAGRLWSMEEDILLAQEVRTAVAQIAKNHSRSIIAIKSRIEQKELI